MITERIPITLDDTDPFEAVLIKAVVINRLKRKDYAGDGWWSQNFYDSAYQVNSTAGMSCETLIATKQSRLRVLLQPGVKPKNEAVEDTLLDRFVYSGISLGLWSEGGYKPKELIVAEAVDV